MRSLLLLLLAALLAGSLLFHFREEQRLSRDWQALRQAASASGLRLAGRPDRRSGWPAGASLSIVQPALTSGADSTGLSAKAILLRRSLPDPGVLVVEPNGTLTLQAAGGRWHLWARHLSARRAGRGWKLAADGLRLAHGSGPDDVASVETGRADLAASDPVLRLRLTAAGIVLPLSSVPLADRRIASVSLEGVIATVATHRELAITRASLTWGELTARMAGRLRWRNGTPSGRLLLTLGPGWRAAIERAGASRLISPSQAQAAIGLLSVLSADGQVVLPLAVQDGRVTLDGLALVVLPRLSGSPD